jgi:hypothetical protein
MLHEAGNGRKSWNWRTGWDAAPDCNCLQHRIGLDQLGTRGFRVMVETGTEKEPSP